MGATAVLMLRDRARAGTLTHFRWRRRLHAADGIALLVHRIDEHREVTDDDRRAVRNIDDVATKQEITGDRSVGRDVFDAQRAVTRGDDGVLARDEIAIEAKRALRMSANRERTRGRIKLRPLLSRV